MEASGDTGRHGSPPRRDTGSGLGSAPGAARNTQAGGSASASTPEGQSTDAELEIDGEGAAAEQTGTFPLRAGPDGVKLGKAAPFAPAVGWKVNPSAEPDSITLEIEGIGNDRAHDVYWSPEAEFPQGWRAAGLRPGHFALPVPGPGNYWLFVIGYDRNGRSPDGREAREVSEVVMVRVRNVVEVADGDVTPRSPLVDPRG